MLKRDFDICELKTVFDGLSFEIQDTPVDGETAKVIIKTVRDQVPCCDFNQLKEGDAVEEIIFTYYQVGPDLFMPVCFSNVGTFYSVDKFGDTLHVYDDANIRYLFTKLTNPFAARIIRKVSREMIAKGEMIGVYKHDYRSPFS